MAIYFDCSKENDIRNINERYLAYTQHLEKEVKDSKIVIHILCGLIFLCIIGFWICGVIEVNDRKTESKTLNKVLILYTGKYNIDKEKPYGAIEYENKQMIKDLKLEGN